MPTTPSTSLDIDLSLVVEDADEEICHECIYQGLVDRVATWGVYTTQSCSDVPNPTPICEFHKEIYDEYLKTYGYKHWMCGACGNIAHILKIERLRR